MVFERKEPMPSSGLCWFQVHTKFTYIHLGKLSYIFKKLLAIKHTDFSFYVYLKILIIKFFKHKYQSKIKKKQVHGMLARGVMHSSSSILQMRMQKETFEQTVWLYEPHTLKMFKHTFIQLFQFQMLSKQDKCKKYITFGTKILTYSVYVP